MLDEPQVTEVVRSCLVPLPYVAVAVNPKALPGEVVALAGVIATEIKGKLFTVSTAEPVTEPDVAVTVD